MAPSPSDTAFVLVPGAFCPASYYDKVTTLLQQAGYEVALMDHRTAGRRDQRPLPTMYDDAEHVRAKIIELGDQGKNVVLVGNSYGGTVITEAPKGVTSADREAAGKKGGVTHLIYIASLLAPVGISTRELLGDTMPDGLFTEENGYCKAMDAANAGAVLCAALSKEDQEHYGAMQMPMSVQAFESKLTYAAWQHIPTTVITVDADKALDSEFAHKAVNDALAKYPEAKVKQVSIDADHVAMLSHPKEVTEILLSDPPT